MAGPDRVVPVRVWLNWSPESTRQMVIRGDYFGIRLIC
jgi:hypothetical protein